MKLGDPPTVTHSFSHPNSGILPFQPALFYASSFIVLCAGRKGVGASTLLSFNHFLHDHVMRVRPPCHMNPPFIALHYNEPMYSAAFLSHSFSL